MIPTNGMGFLLLLLAAIVAGFGWSLGSILCGKLFSGSSKA